MQIEKSKCIFNYREIFLYQEIFKLLVREANLITVEFALLVMRNIYLMRFLPVTALSLSKLNWRMYTNCVFDSNKILH